MTALLTPIREITLAGRPAFTTTEQSFTDAGVKWMSDSFRAKFIGLEVAETDPLPFLENNLEHDSVDDLIIAELCGAENAETSTTHFINLLATNKGSSKIFILYLRGNDKNLWVVGADWDVVLVGWSVCAYSTSRQGVWRDGHSIVSRKRT